MTPPDMCMLVPCLLPLIQFYLATVAFSLSRAIQLLMVFLPIPSSWEHVLTRLLFSQNKTCYGMEQISEL
jgi:hypothetical protein